MKKYCLLMLVLLITIKGITQEQKVKLAFLGTNNFAYTMIKLHESFDDYADSPKFDRNSSSSSSSWYNITSLGLGVNVQIKKSNMSIYGVYGLKGYIDIGLANAVKSYEFHNHFLGIAIEYNLLSELKRFRPYIHCTILTEIYPSYKDKYIDKSFLYPFNKNTYPIIGWLSTGSEKPIIPIYGNKFYQKTPIMFGISAGYSVRIFNGFQLNLSLGYNLTRWHLKYVRWMNSIELEEKFTKAPDFNYSLHSMIVQFGLNYTFSFNKKDKITIKN
jgi:hypothetical protein